MKSNFVFVEGIHVGIIIYCDCLAEKFYIWIKISEQRDKEHRTRVLSKGLFKSKITLLNVSVWLGTFFSEWEDLGKNRVVFEALLHYLYIWSLFLLILLKVIIVFCSKECECKVKYNTITSIMKPNKSNASCYVVYVSCHSVRSSKGPLRNWRCWRYYTGTALRLSYKNYPRSSLWPISSGIVTVVLKLGCGLKETWHYRTIWFMSLIPWKYEFWIWLKERKKL